ncbi:unnamed protein product [Euphydryas editha]|uniref:Uncharacterized protein n=1 Tax=Euphydryas editha TaxID=104508 RepID=A0AAU9UWW5_EUPED|nr:unnamed protein product [Euphydryas editha]
MKLRGSESTCHRGKTNASTRTRTQVTVWCGYVSGGIIGQIFFENEQENAITVNGDCYRTMLSDFMFAKIEKYDIDDI